MRAQEIIRNILDMLDQAVEPEIAQDEPGGYTDDDIERFRQIAGIVNTGNESPLSNSPNERVADIDAVTIHAGGGMNGPKHPHDLRVKDPSMYPNQQEC